MAGAIRDNIPDESKIALVNPMALLDREREQVRFTEFKAAFKQTFTTTPPPQAHFMAKTPVGTMIIGTIIRNAGVTLTPGTMQRANPRTLDQGISLHTGPGRAVHTLQGLGKATTGQVLN